MHVVYERCSGIDVHKQMIYIDGLSLKAITEKIQIVGVAYHETNRIWNKNMVNRILGNEKYLGTEKFPQIIENNVFGKAQKAVLSRKQFGVINDLAAVMKNKLFCSDCGERYIREYKTKKTTIWYCKCENNEIHESELQSTLKTMIDGVAGLPKISKVNIHHFSRLDLAVQQNQSSSLTPVYNS